jgi:tRNA-Thr(GGU) m(6)t(6)A37 methyltransferase TsaA
MECTQIGYVETPYESRNDAPRQGAFGETPGTIHVASEYRDGLQGFEPDRDVTVVWFANLADRTELVSTKRQRGVFATRSPARPNPICITECRVAAVDVAAGELEVSGVDMVDGSPLLDLKPTIH